MNLKWKSKLFERSCSEYYANVTYI